MTEPNYYDLIGVNRNARASEIRQAYYQRAKQLHPDKKGGDPELMKTLTVAYQTLSDADRKAEYDENLEEEIAAGSNPEISATLSERYSTKYRIRHGLYRTRFATGSHAEDSDSSSDEDLEGLGRSGEGNAPSGKKFRHLSDSWQCYYEYGNAQHESIFHLTTAIRRRLPASSLSDKVPPLLLPTVRQAVSEFIRLLKFDGTTVAASWYCQLRQLKEALERKLPADPNADAGEQVLYRGMHEILSIALEGKLVPLHSSPTDEYVATVCRLLKAVGNISSKSLSLLRLVTDAIVFAHATLGDVTTLLDCVKYRKLFNFVMSLDIRLPGLREAKRLDGRQVAKDLLERIKNVRADGRNGATIRDLRRMARLAVRMEEEFYRNRAPDGRLTADTCREYAFRFLDWWPSVPHVVGGILESNVLLQAGLAMATAGELEADSARRNADQRIAAQLFREACAWAREFGGAHEELYTLRFALTCLNCTVGRLPHLKAMARRADWLTEVFPFYWQPQSNAEWLKQVLEGSAKRKAEGTHLRNLVQILEGASSHDIELDVNPERVYYHAFEACLKGWYPVEDGEDRATLAEQFRQRLMTIMLANRRWTFADVDFNLNAPEPLSACDDDGWFRHSADPLEWLRGTKVPTYSTVRGFKIDATNGEVSIAAVPDSKGLVSFLDVMQLCRLAPDGVYFSLDPPDGDMSYHPFNLMRFGPPRMWSSLMMHTMFETDYILKSLTVGVEIQRIGNRVEEATEAAEAEVSEGGNAPDKGLYNMRDLRPLIESLPSPLKTAILDFHANERSQRALSRFWIESEPTSVSVEQRGSGVTYLLGDTPMRVKTEMMFRNELGKLEDAKDSDLPGWSISSVTPELWEKIVKRKWISPKIDAHGQLFSVGIGAVNGHYMEKYVFWQYGAPVASVIDSAFEQSANIRELGNIKKNMEGFDWSQEAGDLRSIAARTPEEHVTESKAEALIFKITCWAAEKTGMHHRFSAEYCLAMALTEHYALLERHFPVFARLRELSKLLAVVRLMNAVHEKANTDADLAPIRKSFDHFRLSKSRKIELDLSAECLWVPAQFRLSSTASAFRMVYGGVLASGSIYTRGAGGGQGGSSDGGDSGGGGGIKYTPINFVNGRMYELQVRSILDQNGVYYREQVTTRTEDGIRKNDFVVLCAQTDRVLAVLECKSSDTARYPADQRLKDNYWRAQGIPVYEVRPGTEQQILSSLPGSSTTGHLSRLPFFRSFRPN